MTIKELIQDLELLQNEKMTCSNFRIKYFSRDSNVSELPDLVGSLSHYLDDEDLRIKDSEYKLMQNNELEKLISLLKANASEEKLKTIHFLGASEE